MTGWGCCSAFAYISKYGWEASFAFAPGTFTGEAGLNVHALVAPEERRHRRQRSRTAGSMSPSSVQCPLNTDSDSLPHAGADVTPSASAEPSALPSESASVEPSALPSESASLEPSAPPSESPLLEPSALPSESASGAPSALPSGSAEPSGDPPIIVIKVADQGKIVERRRRGGRGSTVRDPSA